jgi:molybdate transport system ATP-binding protein
MLEIDIKKNIDTIYGSIFLDVDLSINKGDFVAIVGESGSGKTTLLRVIAGLDKADGKVIFGNQIWQDKQTFLPPSKRDIGFVFQDYALFPNMTILENLLFANDDINFAKSLLELSALENLAHKKPHQLSGGQQQRVSLCRALMNKPKLLLLDEPFSALNQSIKDKLQTALMQFQKDFDTTIIMVSHNKSEIYTMANKIIYIKNGKAQESQKNICHNLTAKILKIDQTNLATILIGDILSQKKLPDNHHYKIGDELKLTFELKV